APPGSMSSRVHYPECPIRYKIVGPSTWRLDGNAMSDYAVVNPATGETLATYPTITDDALEAAVAGADAAVRAGRGVRVAARGAKTRRGAELPREGGAELAAIIVGERGKPLAAAVGEVDFAADITEYYADNAKKVPADQPLDILGEGTAVIR